MLEYLASPFGVDLLSHAVLGFVITIRQLSYSLFLDAVLVSVALSIPGLCRYVTHIP